MTAQRVGVVGAGIVGLSYAFGALQRGHRVTVFERHARAQGATVRNFGMLWPIGQALTPSYDVAIESRGVWDRLAAEAGLWLEPRGSLHVAHEDDEMEVLREFHAMAHGAGVDCRLLDAQATLTLSPIVNPAGLRGGLSSPTEAGIDPRRAASMLASHLRDRGVRFHFDTTVTAVDTGALTTADGRSHAFERIIVCGGSDVDSIFPGLLSRLGIRRCKLQMLATRARDRGPGIGPFLAGGLTLRHYGNFAACPSLAAVRRRIAGDTPELDRFGIHVMVAENQDGRLILGDSHEYDDAITPFDRAGIDEIILRELRRIAILPDWTIDERWHGIYGKHASLPIVRSDPASGVSVRVGTGGGGMTLAPGLAAEDWRAWDEGATR